MSISKPKNAWDRAKATIEYMVKEETVLDQFVESMRREVEVFLQKTEDAAGHSTVWRTNTYGLYAQRLAQQMQLDGYTVKAKQIGIDEELQIPTWEFVISWRDRMLDALEDPQLSRYEKEIIARRTGATTNG